MTNLDFGSYVMSEVINKIELIDDLDKEEIEHLHKAVTGFSTQSFELKKLCVTVELSVCTLIVTIFRDDFGNDFLFALRTIFLLIPVLFYIVDITTYYYQDKLRYLMFNVENNIRRRHKIELKINSRFSSKQSTWQKRILRGICNASNNIYWCLIFLGIVFFIIA